MVGSLQVVIFLIPDSMLQNFEKFVNGTHSVVPPANASYVSLI